MTAPVIVRFGHGGDRTFVVRDRGVSHVLRWEVSEQVGPAQFTGHQQFRLQALAERSWESRVAVAHAAWHLAAARYFAGKLRGVYAEPLSPAAQERAEHYSQPSSMPDHRS